MASPLCSKKVDWDKFAQDLQKEEKEEKLEGDAVRGCDAHAILSWQAQPAHSPAGLSRKLRQAAMRAQQGARAPCVHHRPSPAALG